MLPMGTIMACCMLAGFAGTASPQITAMLPKFLRNLIGYVVFAAGLWNVFWYGAQHLTEFWGQAALVSGALMLITAMYLIAPSKLPAVLRKGKPFILLGLLACFLLYAITIYRL